MIGGEKGEKEKKKELQEPYLHYGNKLGIGLILSCSTPSVCLQAKIGLAYSVWAKYVTIKIYHRPSAYFFMRWS